MAARRRRQPEALRRYWASRRRRPRGFSGRSSRRFARRFRRRRWYSGLLSTSRRRRGRVSFRFNRRRHYRHNPGSAFTGVMRLPFGLEAPAITDVVFGMAGLFVPNMVTTRVMAYVPASMQGSSVVTWLVKIVSVLVPGMLIRKYVNPRAGYAFMIGGAASLLADAIKSFAPSLAATIGLGYQPLLGFYPGGVITGGMGAYTGRQVRGSRPVASLAPIISGTPDRLDPTNRF